MKYVEWTLFILLCIAGSPLSAVVFLWICPNPSPRGKGKAGVLLEFPRKDK
jgi:hypothetical protein